MKVSKTIRKDHFAGVKGDLKFKARRKFNGNDKINDKELKALEELERKEGNSHINDD